MKISHPSQPHVSHGTHSAHSGPKVYTVAPPDDEELFERQMAEIEQATDQAQSGEEQVESKVMPEDPLLKKEVEKKMAFEKLMFLSQPHTKEIEYGGLTFKFKVLTSNDNAKILDLLHESNMTEIYQASVMGLAASLLSVNDIPFESFYTGEEQISNVLLRKYSELSRWPAFMVTALTAFSASVQRETEKEFGKSFLDK
jgi:hypothetical protein